MKTLRSSQFLTILFVICLMVLNSCTTPVGLTSWKNPDAKGTVSKILVDGIFDRMDIIQPMENECVTYFSSQNLPAVKGLDILNPFKQYSQNELKQKLDSIQADGMLIITYKSKSVDVNVTPGFYGGYRGYWGSTGSVYVDKTYYLRAMLYTTKGDALLWSGDLTVTNPNDITSAAQQIAQKMFGDWAAKGLLKNPPPVQGK